MIVKMKSEEQLIQEKAFRDGAGDYWPDEAAHESWAHTAHTTTAQSPASTLGCAFRSTLGKTFLYKTQYARSDTSATSWAIDIFYTREEYPEYYL